MAAYSVSLRHSDHRGLGSDPTPAPMVTLDESAPPVVTLSWRGGVVWCGSGSGAPSGSGALQAAPQAAPHSPLSSPLAVWAGFPKDLAWLRVK